MRLMTSELRLIRNRDREIWAEDTVVFHNHDYRIDNRDFLPNPVVIAIDVDTQKPDLTGKTGLVQELIDIIPSNKSATRSERMAPINLILLNVIDGIFVSIQDQTAPVIVQKQKARI